MSNKISYEIVSAEADKLIVSMVLFENYFHYQDLYYEFLDACGWTDREYDDETLRRIDSVWDLLLKLKPNMELICHTYH